MSSWTWPPRRASSNELARVVGLEIEVCTLEVLEQTWRQAQARHHREHVVPFLYEHPGDFEIGVADLYQNQSMHRWIIGTPADPLVVKRNSGATESEPFGWIAVLEATVAESGIESRNAGQRQKLVTDVDVRRQFCLRLDRRAGWCPQSVTTVRQRWNARSTSRRITLDDHIRVRTRRLQFPRQLPIAGLHRDPLGNDVRQLAQVGRILVEVR